MLANHEGFYNFMYTNGGTALTSDNKSGYTDPKTVEALEYFSFGREGLSQLLAMPWIISLMIRQRWLSLVLGGWGIISIRKS